MSPSLNVVVAPDSFKGSATAAEVAAAIGAGWRDARPDDTVQLLPMADGGEGTIDAFALAVPGAIRIAVRVTGPDDRPVEAEWLWLPPAPGDTGTGGTGVVELANTSGITLLDPLRPLDAHTIGFGQAIAAALDHGVDKLLLAIGGSSSTDGGAGALSALGARFLDGAGEPIVPGARGLAALASADLTGLRALPTDGAVVVTDVTNPLLGENGAAAVFGPQKGADPDTVGELDAALATLARVLGADPAAIAAVDAPVDLQEWSEGDLGYIADPVTGEADVSGFAPAPDGDGSGDVSRDGGVAAPHGQASAGNGAIAAIDLAAPGGGAAGGTGFGLLVWGASIRAGADAVGSAIGLPAQIETADVVITGEGRFDNQSAAGKVPGYVLALAQRFDAFALLVAGSIETDPDDFAALVSLTELAGSSAEAIANPKPFLHAAGRSLAKGDAKTPAAAL
ncbi:glycerate kinase [Subtercola sp. YIM 133946]|uniref:glycerate kinase n=1 Tax=Subtercola sp. YIM 133946 TaxID=3118909 RepID=UPI002F9448EB